MGIFAIYYSFESTLGGETNNKGLQNTETVIGTVFVTSFLGTWLYDVIAAPIKAMKRRMVPEKKLSKTNT